MKRACLQRTDITLGRMDSRQREALEAAGATSEAARRDSAVWVRTTAQGLPVDVRIDPSWMRRGPAALAAEIVDLCALARVRAGVQQRQSLLDSGLPRDVVAMMGLPTPADLAAAEARLDDGDDEVGSWLEKS